ncbi:MAG: hypothetical protein OCU18_01360 [Candidatus Syntrophoarchaeum sp.]|nr:hypothetical protein [Candidatus Syntrophoarchaeum sp.]
MPENARIVLEIYHEDGEKLPEEILSESEIKAMASVYVHLSGRDIDNALLAFHHQVSTQTA